MIRQYFFLALLALLLSGCVHHPVSDQVSLPLLKGWHDGQAMYYVTTDVSDKELAQKMGVNYAPRLADAVPTYPKPPRVKTILERVYAFPNGEQQNTVFASVPTPIGYKSDDINYSPIWLMYIVEWLQKDHVIELRSEGDIFEAEAKGWLKITRTDVVINCPVVSVDGLTFLPVP